MAAIKLGVQVDHLRLGPREGLRRAAGMGFDCVQFDAARGPIAPHELSHTGRRDLAQTVRDRGLELTALAADAGGKRLADPHTAERRIDATKRIIELAADLRVPVVTTALGRFPDQPDDPVHRLVREALTQLGECADRMGTFLAVETADADPQRIADLLRELNCPAIKVNYDPASVIVAGGDPVAGIAPVADYIIGAQLRDAVRSAPDVAREVVLGQGDLPLEEYLAMLDEAGYRGCQMLQRRESQDPAADILAAKRILERL